MLFFRSEEHLKNWADYSEDNKDGIVSLHDLVKLFSIDFFRRRLDADYVSRVPEYMGGFFATLKEIGKSGPFWVP
jgi:acyl-ACP thioesterase